MTTRGIEPAMESFVGFQYRYIDLPLDDQGICTVRNDRSQSDLIVIDLYVRYIYPYRLVGDKRNDKRILLRIPERIRFPALS